MKKYISISICFFLILSTSIIASSKLTESAKDAKLEAAKMELMKAFGSSKEEFKKEDIAELTKKLSEKDANIGEILAKLINKRDPNVVQHIAKYNEKLNPEDKMRIAYHSRNFNNPGLVNLLIQWLEKSDDLFIVEYCIVGLKHQKSEVALNALKKFKSGKRFPEALYINVTLEKALEFMQTSQNAPKNTEG